MSLIYDASTDTCNFGLLPHADDPNPGTIVLCYRRDGTVGNNTWFFSFRNERPGAFASGGTRNPQIRWKSTGTAIDVRTSQSLTTGVWGWWFFTIDTTASQHARIYYGTPSLSVHEPGYTTTTNSTGTLDSTAGHPLIIGNNETEDGNAAGTYFYFALYKRLLQRAEMDYIRTTGGVPLPGCVFSTHLGHFGGPNSPQIDDCYNRRGTTTGTAHTLVQPDNIWVPPTEDPIWVPGTPPSVPDLVAPIPAEYAFSAIPVPQVVSYGDVGA